MDKMTNESEIVGDVKTVHDFDYNLICEYFSGFERQGLGSPEITLRALGFVGELNGTSKIADIGCGTGGQTMTLVQNAPGNITAIDLFPGFISLALGVGVGRQCTCTFFTSAHIYENITGQ